MPGATDHLSLAHAYRGVPLEKPLFEHCSPIAHLTRRAEESGDHPFITAVSERHKAVTLSYAQVDALSRRLADRLRQSLGTGTGDVVALLAANDVPSVVAVFALQRLGCVILMLSPADPVRRLRDQITGVGATVTLRPASVPGDALPEALPLPDPTALPETAGPAHGPAPMADAFLFGTSGSTGTSKLVAQTHYGSTVNAEAVRRHHGLRPGDRLLGCLPVHHVNGLHFTILATLVAGAHAILVEEFDPFRYAEMITRFRPRIASVVPSILAALLDVPRLPALPSGFDYFVSAAAPLRADTVRSVARKMNVRVIQGYGLTETTNFSTTLPADLPESVYRELMLDADIPTVGTALFGNEVVILRSDGTPARDGEHGEICVRGHNLMAGYAGDPEATREAFREGWFHSGDLGFITRHAQTGDGYVVITGRRKNVAKVRGVSVPLEEMERALHAVPCVRDAVCVSLPDRLLGERIIAGVVPSERPCDVEIRDALRLLFAPELLPRKIIYLDRIPRTPTGKLRRDELARTLRHSLAEAPGP